MTVNYQLPNIQKFESIVVPLHNKNINSTHLLLRKQEVVVAVDGSRVNLLIVSREQNLVVVPINDQAIGDSFLHVVRPTVIVND